MKKIEKELVSIIVPIYNTEKYILDLLNCIKLQTYKNWELILINDGSTDNSYKVCEKFREDNNNLKIINIYTENAGVSSARNLGIKNANGEFIVFFDSDDTIEFNIIEKLVKKSIEEKSDFVVSNIKVISKNKVKIQHLSNNDETCYPFLVSIFNSNIAKKVYSLDYKFSRNLGGKIYKNEVIIKNNILFDPKMYLLEDGFFNLKYALNVTKISYLNECLYNYFIDNGSSYKFRENLYMENIYKINEINKITLNKGEELEIAKKMYYLDLFTAFIKRYIKNSSTKLNYREKIDLVKKIIKSNEYNEMLDNRIYIFLNLKKKLIYILLKFRLYEVILFIL